MRIIGRRVAVLLTAVLVFLTSCEKELSFEKENIARYTLEGGTSFCSGAVVSGIYKAGEPVSGDSKVVLNVFVDSTGDYDISVFPVNGLSFSGSGTFTTTGAQTITLAASGTPTVSGIYHFTPIPGGCTFSVTVEAGTGSSGVYSYVGGAGACTDAQISGTFTAGTATTSSNTVTLKVNVSIPGSYTIFTNTINGIKFSGTGIFTRTGEQVVTLTASGTPLAAGNFSFTPGSNGCSFNIIVNPATGGGAGSGGGSGNFLKCKIDGVLSNFNASLIGYYVTPPASGFPYSAAVMGRYSDMANSPIELSVTVANPTAPNMGVYSNLTFSLDPTKRGCEIAWSPSGANSLFWGSSPLNENTFTVNITSISTGGATGTFSGTIYEGNGIGPGTKQVTEGEFKITF